MIVNVAFMFTVYLGINWHRFDKAATSNLSFEHFFCYFGFLFQNGLSFFVIFFIDFRLKFFLQTCTKKIFKQNIVNGIALKYICGFICDLKFFESLNFLFVFFDDILDKTCCVLFCYEFIH
jgi:hypothetical protein